MGTDAQKQVVLTDEAKKKLVDCVSSLATCGFGPDGPPRETTFAEIEDFGHEVGRIVARAVHEKLTEHHATHFQGPAACPCCNTMCPAAENPATRRIQTTDGEVSLHEPVFHCPVCNRDFFPSAYLAEDRWPILQPQGP